jgi:exopolysaccharide production protein ExoY
MKMLVAHSPRKGADFPTDGMSPQREVLPIWKRTLDIACCLVALPMLSLCTVFVAIMTRMASPGPIFFRQERVGRGGRTFMIYKFRTMHVCAESSAHQTYFAQLVRSNAPMHKLDARGDSRLIPAGKVIRASGLDELPQIINVLRGEMSIVGPRPSIPYEYAQYTAAQKQRFDVTPGLTGLWQVSGKNHTTFDEMVRLDIQYARTRSPRLDLTIILRTVPVLFLQLIESGRRSNAASTGYAKGAGMATAVGTKGIEENA